mgnify:FL=1
MDEEQRFAFDTWGFLVVEDALTWEQVTSLKKSVDIKGPDLGSQHADRGGFWSQEFVDLLDLPSISPILTKIYGGTGVELHPPYRIDHINIHTHGTFNKDLAGGTIHGRNERLINPERPQELMTHYFEHDNKTGTFENGLVTVAYELEDTVCNGGGFGCLAGSHKGNYPVPENWVDLSKNVHSMITHVPAKAGDAIIFTEALCHVTLPWRVDSTRTTLFYKYTKPDEAYSQPNNFFDPSDADEWKGVNNRTRAILSPPPLEAVERKIVLANEYNL